MDEVGIPEIVYLAKCGHEDMLGYFGNTYCKRCADAGYASVMGRSSRSSQVHKSTRVTRKRCQ